MKLEDHASHKMKGLMTEGKNNAFCTYVHRKHAEIDMVIRNPYIDLVLGTNRIHCYKCRLPINNGEQYEKGSAGGAGHNRVRKFYHKSCWEQTYQ